MRFFFPGLLLCLLPAGAQAAPSQDWSASLATGGLGQTEATLSALQDPSPDDLFVLGGVRFLMGIEQALHLRWKMGVTGEIAPVPILRLQLPANPEAEPVRADLLTQIFRSANAHMELAEAALAAIPAGAEIGVTINTGDLWFDIDGNGARGPGEDVLPMAIGAITVPMDQPGEPPPTSIRFDTADVAWLRAYGHLISAVGSFVLAFDPTSVVQRMMDAQTDRETRLASPNPSTLDRFVGEDLLGKLALTILALRQQPDPAMTRATSRHLKEMLRLNHAFWQAVGAETDNQAEWIPNARQTAGLGFILPPDTEQMWLGVLAELELMLDGKLLVPHLTMPPEAGVNIAKWLENPNPLDLVGWLQGMDALPYVERGPVITGEAWTAFEQLVEGRGVFFALLLN